MTRRRSLWILLASASCALLVAGIVTFLAKQRSTDPVERLELIKSQVRKNFPDAPRITTEELADRLDSGEQIVLLDVRRPDEFAVSHLPGAIRVDPDAASPALPEGIPADAQVVTYCAVGWRSAKWTEALRRQGVEAVNLEGSIFQWVAENRPLVRDGEPVDVVHPYSRAWAWLVDPEDRAFTPGQ